MHIRGESVRLRRVREDDCRLLWEWANDPEVRAVSFSSESIPWEEHLRWFNAKLGNSGCLLLIAEDSAGVPIGQVRFDVVRKNEAVISVSVDRENRGKGFGSTIIRLASQKLCDLTEINVIHAYIKQNNEASFRAFMKAGYKESGVTMISGHQAVHLVFQKQGRGER
jgi:RimJ/RimL family protein N-acetyltransferase